ncbi:uncharacterized protein LOC143225399 [Tachypleus tridentatus]|uniref:uncharacterized protein LOC143225399 n=1 Tax=Tachypleus tridentatus TaxID=6853 RepID=UPI003FD3ABCF
MNDTEKTGEVSVKNVFEDETLRNTESKRFRDTSKNKVSKTNDGPRMGLRPRQKRKLTVPQKILNDHSDSEDTPANSCQIKTKTKFSKLQDGQYTEGDSDKNDQSKATSSKKNRRCQCQICGKWLSNPIKLSHHLRIHSGEKKFKCEVCGKAFRWEYSWKSHLLSHSEDNPYQCEHCGVKVTSKGALNNHILRVHSNPDRNFECEKCRKRFLSNSELQQHLFRHTSNKPFMCEFCGNSFRSKGSMEVHYRTHTGERPFECEFCKKTFAYKNSLVGHIRIHTGERPFRCNYCGKQYRMKHELTSHMIVHSDIRPYKCDQCEKTFRSKTNFKMHKDFHKGIKPHVCEICGRSFLSRGNMGKHVRRHRGERPHSCDKCGKAFFEKQELKNHMKTHTDGKKSRPRKRCPSVTSSRNSKSMDVFQYEKDPKISSDFQQESFNVVLSTQPNVTIHHSHFPQTQDGESHFPSNHGQESQIINHHGGNLQQFHTTSHESSGLLEKRTASVHSDTFTTDSHFVSMLPRPSSESQVNIVTSNHSSPLGPNTMENHHVISVSDTHMPSLPPQYSVSRPPIPIQNQVSGISTSVLPVTREEQHEIQVPPGNSLQILVVSQGDQRSLQGNHIPVLNVHSNRLQDLQVSEFHQLTLDKTTSSMLEIPVGHNIPIPVSLIEADRHQTEFLQLPNRDQSLSRMARPADMVNPNTFQNLTTPSVLGYDSHQAMFVEEYENSHVLTQEVLFKCKFCRNVYSSQAGVKRHLVEYHRFEPDRVHEFVT